MESFDKFSNNILEEAKRFYEKARDAETQVACDAYIHSSLLLAISSIEAYVNGVSEEFKGSSIFNDFEKGFILEKEVSLNKGKFKIGKKLKMSRLTDRIEFLFVKFDPSKLDTSTAWWGNLKTGIKLRNSLVHPKEFTSITIDQIEKTLNAVITCINQLFLAVYKKKLPCFNMGLDSKLTF